MYFDIPIYYLGNFAYLFISNLSTDLGFQLLEGGFFPFG